jgi:hypothetical protein
MTVKVPLRLQGIDLRDTEAYDRIPPELEELFWMANGAVSLAVVLSDIREIAAAADAAEWARRIVKHMLDAAGIAFGNASASVLLVASNAPTRLSRKVAREAGAPGWLAAWCRRRARRRAARRRPRRVGPG